MLSAWKLPMTRPTKDIDMLAIADNDLESVRGMIVDVCRVSIEDDGLSFDGGWPSHGKDTTNLSHFFPVQNPASAGETGMANSFWYLPYLIQPMPLRPAPLPLQHDQPLVAHGTQLALDRR